MKSTPPIHILVEYQEPVVAAGLCAILRQQSDFVVRAASDDVHAPASHDDQPFDIVVTDYSSGVNRLSTQRRPTQLGQSDSPRVLIVAKQSSETEVSSAICAGAHGYLLQSCEPSELVDGVRSVGHGTRYLCSSATDYLAGWFLRPALTSRELEVLEGVVQGKCNKSIARELDIALGTVKSHVKGILTKLEATSRTHAVSVAVQRGLIGVGGTVALRGEPIARALPQ